MQYNLIKVYELAEWIATLPIMRINFYFYSESSIGGWVCYCFWMGAYRSMTQTYVREWRFKTLSDLLFSIWHTYRYTFSSYLLYVFKHK